MATGGFPFHAPDIYQLMYELGRGTVYAKYPPDMSLQVQDFISRCLQHSWDKRQSAKQLLSHPLLDQINPMRKYPLLSPGDLARFERPDDCADFLQRHELWRATFGTCDL